MISIAYGASIGGTATINGAIANYTFKGIFETFFPKSIGISFGTFMLYSIPVALLSGILICVWLNFLLGKGLYSDTESSGKAREWIRKQREELGPMSAKEIFILIIVVLVFLIWAARDLGVLSGWKEWFYMSITNATPGLIAVALLFVIPGNWAIFNFCRNRAWPTTNSQGLITWKAANDRIPWGMIFVLGAGFAITFSMEKTKLTLKISEAIGGLKDQSGYLLMFVACLISQIVGTLSAGAAVACIVLPFLAQIAVASEISPIFLMFPATLCISHAFMFPNACSPNSVIAELANVPTKLLVRILISFYKHLSI